MHFFSNALWRAAAAGRGMGPVLRSRVTAAVGWAGFEAGPRPLGRSRVRTRLMHDGHASGAACMMAQRRRWFEHVSAEWSEHGHGMGLIHMRRGMMQMCDIVIRILYNYIEMMMRTG